MRLILWKLLSCSSCCVCFQTLSARLMYDDWLAGLTLHAAMLFLLRTSRLLYVLGSCWRQFNCSTTSCIQ